MPRANDLRVAANPSVGVRPYDVFISCSGDTSWASDLRNAIQKRWPQNQAQAHVYLYTGQPLGHSIPRELEDALRSSRVLLCIVDDAYLRSAHCLREHHIFSTLTDRTAIQGSIIPVLSPRLASWGTVEQQRTAFAASAQALGNDVRAKYPDLEAELLADTPAWHAMLESNRSVDLRPFSNINPKNLPKKLPIIDNFIADLSQRLDANEIPFTEQQLAGMSRSAGLSALALGIDRYHEGGWGFSFGQRFEYDEDGIFLTKGRYDFNLLILRALREFLLDENDIIEELNATLETSQPTKQTHVEVKDRIPDISKYAAYFVAHLRDELLLSLGDILDFAATLVRDSSAERWRFHTDLSAAKRQKSDVVLFFEFLTRLELAANDQVIKRRIEGSLKQHDVKKFVTTVEGHLKTWYEENQLFSMASAGPDELPAQQTARWLSDFDRILGLLVLYRLLASTGRGAYSVASKSLGLLEGPVERVEALRHLNSIVAAAEWALRSLQAAGTPPCDVLEGQLDSARLWTLINLFSLLLSDLQHHVSNDDLRTCANRLARVSLEFFCAPAALPVLLQADAVTWASTILLTQRLGFPLDRRWLANLWRLGRKLRSDRIAAVSTLGVERLLKGAIHEWVQDRCDKLVRQPDPARLFKEAGDEVTVVRWLEGASFWGRSPLGAPVPGLEPTGTGTIGVLKVRLLAGDKEQVEFGSEGYNQLFLHPFSRMAALSIFNLPGIIREIGSSDNILVYQMGSVVVEGCYAPDAAAEGGRISWKRCDFMERTKRLTTHMRSPGWSVERGAKDILRIRTGIQPHHYRLVLRSAHIERAQEELLSRESAARIITWTFLDITSELDLEAVDLDAGTERFTLAAIS